MPSPALASVTSPLTPVSVLDDPRQVLISLLLSFYHEPAHLVTTSLHLIGQRDENLWIVGYVRIPQGTTKASLRTVHFHLFTPVHVCETCLPPTILP